MVWQLQEAKNKLSQVVENALSEGPQEITRRGKKAVVLILCLLGSLFSPAFAASSTDRAFLLDNLKQYSPKGYYIVNTYQKKFRDTVNVMEYFDNSSELALMDSFNTTVHEFTHGYASLKGMDEIYVIVSPKESYRVPIGKLFPSRDMVSSFPKYLRTFRFSYIDTDEKYLGTQIDGIYGLLDEMTAYLSGVETSLDLLPFFVSQGEKADWGTFFQTIDGTLYALLEFKLYILKYLDYAKQNRPDVYRDVMDNDKFRKAFTAIDQRSNKFIRRYFATREQLMLKLEKQGDYKFIDEPDMLQIIHKGKSTWQGHFLEVYTVLSRELNKSKYRDLVTVLADYKKQESYPLIVLNISRNRFVLKGSGKPVVVVNVTDDPKDKPPVPIDLVLPDLPVPPEKTLKPEIDPGKMTWKDKKGDTAYKFMDITGASALVFEDDLVFKVSFAVLPGKLLFNNPNLKKNSLEYSWAVKIDQDGDGQVDYSLSVDKYKFSGALPLEASVMSYVQTGVWKIDQGGGSLTEIPLQVEWKANTITFRVKKDGVFGQITEDSQVSFTSYYDDGRMVHRDELLAK